MATKVEETIKGLQQTISDIRLQGEQVGEQIAQLHGDDLWSIRLDGEKIQVEIVRLRAQVFQATAAVLLADAEERAAWLKALRRHRAGGGTDLVQDEHGNPAISVSGGVASRAQRIQDQLKERGQNLAKAQQWVVEARDVVVTYNPVYYLQCMQVLTRVGLSVLQAEVDCLECQLRVLESGVENSRLYQEALS